MILDSVWYSFDSHNITILTYPHISLPGWVGAWNGHAYSARSSGWSGLPCPCTSWTPSNAYNYDVWQLGCWDQWSSEPAWIFLQIWNVFLLSYIQLQVKFISPQRIIHITIRSESLILNPHQNCCRNSWSPFCKSSSAWWWQPASSLSRTSLLLSSASDQFCFYCLLLIFYLFSFFLFLVFIACIRFSLLLLSTSDQLVIASNGAWYIQCQFYCQDFTNTENYG